MNRTNVSYILKFTHSSVVIFLSDSIWGRSGRLAAWSFWSFGTELDQDFLNHSMRFIWMIVLAARFHYEFEMRMGTRFKVNGLCPNSNTSGVSCLIDHLTHHVWRFFLNLIELLTTRWRANIVSLNPTLIPGINPRTNLRSSDFLPNGRWAIFPWSYKTGIRWMHQSLSACVLIEVLCVSKSNSRPQHRSSHSLFCFS